MDVGLTAPVRKAVELACERVVAEPWARGHAVRRFEHATEPGRWWLPGAVSRRHARAAHGID